jgi:ABC-type antimicrobial peptide transport system permease subunit
LNFSLIIIAISTIIGFLSGVFPSRRAAHLDPLEALRYK